MKRILIFPHCGDVSGIVTRHVSTPAHMNFCVYINLYAYQVQCVSTVQLSRCCKLVKGLIEVCETSIAIYSVFSAFFNVGSHVEDMVPGSYVLSETYFYFLQFNFYLLFNSCYKEYFASMTFQCNWTIVSAHFTPPFHGKMMQIVLFHAFNRSALFQIFTHTG